MLTLAGWQNPTTLNGSQTSSKPDQNKCFHAHITINLQLWECDLHRARALCLMARCWLILIINESTQALLSILQVLNNIHVITPVLMPDLDVENDMFAPIHHTAIPQ